MPQAFSFDLTEYKNVFPAEIIQSEVAVNPNAPADQANQFWRLCIVHIEKVGEEWRPVKGKCLFEVNGNAVCPMRAEAPIAKYADTWHHHWNVWSSNNPQSAAYKLLDSFKTKGKFIPNEAKDVLHKRYQWEEVITPPYQKRDGSMSRPIYNYYIVGELDVPEPLADDELPWESLEQHQAAVNPVAETAIDQPVATNGTAPTAASPLADLKDIDLTMDDIDALLPSILVGKTEDEGKTTIRNTPEIYGNKEFRLKFIQGTYAEGAITKGFLRRGADGKWEAPSGTL